jgi:hypothetical protein
MRRQKVWSSDRPIVKIENKMIFWMAVISCSVFACLLVTHFVMFFSFTLRKPNFVAGSYEVFLPVADIPTPLVRTEPDFVPPLTGRTIIKGQRISYGAC